MKGRQLMCSSCPQVSIWDDGLDWESQPPELKALGKRRAERVFFRMMDKVYQEASAEIDAKHATMTPQEIAASEQEAREYLLGVAIKDGPAKRWFDKK